MKLFTGVILFLVCCLFVWTNIRYDQQEYIKAFMKSRPIWHRSFIGLILVYFGLVFSQLYL